MARLQEAFYCRECLEVANSYIHGTGYRPNGMTRGLYYRGVQ